jgi:peroxiredoxin
MNIEIIGISRDLGPSQNEFKTKVGAKNSFYSDLEGTVGKAYGAVNPGRPNLLRHYYLLGEDGNIIWKNTTGQLIPVEKLIADLETIIKSN